MNTKDLKQLCRKPMVVSAAMLFSGLLIGVAAERCAVYGGVLTAKAPTENASRAPNGATTTSPIPDPFISGGNDPWDPFQEMRNFQAEMDAMFQHSMAGFGLGPQLNHFMDDAGQPAALEVRELPDRYEVHAFMPDAKTADAKVTLDGNRLAVEVTHRQTASQANSAAGGSTSELSHTAQVVELAGSLDGGRMKVEHKERELLITIPKA